MRGNSLPARIRKASLSLKTRFNSWISMDDTHDDGPLRKRRRLSSWLSYGSWSSKCEIPRPAEGEQEVSAKWDFDPELRKEVSNCRRCQISVSESMRLADLASGVYDPLRTPAYIPPRACKDELIDPFDKPEPSGQNAADRPVANSSQQQQQRRPSRAPAPVQEFGLNQPGGAPEGTSAALRLYASHRHMHEHLFRQQTFLSMCRTDEELKDYRLWVWMTLEDELARRGVADHVIQAGRTEVRLGVWPFTSETGRNQMRLWLDHRQERKNRVASHRRRWRQIKTDLELRRQVVLWRMARKQCRPSEIRKTIKARRMKKHQEKQQAQKP